VKSCNIVITTTDYFHIGGAAAEYVSSLNISVMLWEMTAVILKIFKPVNHL